MIQDLSLHISCYLFAPFDEFDSYELARPPISRELDESERAAVDLSDLVIFLMPLQRLNPLLPLVGLAHCVGWGGCAQGCAGGVRASSLRRRP